MGSFDHKPSSLLRLSGVGHESTGVQSPGGRDSKLIQIRVAGGKPQLPSLSVVRLNLLCQVDFWILQPGPSRRVVPLEPLWQVGCHCVCAELICRHYSELLLVY